jgi:hypothetical protein
MSQISPGGPVPRTPPIPPGGPVPRTPLFSSLYRRGLISMVTGPALVVAGFATGIRLMALAGVVVLAWGVYRFVAARGTAR